MKYYSDRHYQRFHTRQSALTLARAYAAGFTIALVVIMVLVLKLQGWN